MQIYNFFFFFLNCKTFLVHNELIMLQFCFVFTHYIFLFHRSCDRYVDIEVYIVPYEAVDLWYKSY